MKVVLLLGLFAAGASAWVAPHVKRTASAAVVATILATTGAPIVNAVVDFSGPYADPKHPNCLRSIEVVTKSDVSVSGTDGTPGCPADGSGNPWKLSGSVSGSTILVDFSPKGGPKNLQGIYVDSSSEPGIQWPDGNKWTRIASVK